MIEELLLDDVQFSTINDTGVFVEAGLNNTQILMVEAVYELQRGNTNITLLAESGILA